MTDLKNDPEFHLEVGIDIAYRTWKGSDVITHDELLELGRAQLQDADYGAAARATVEQRHPQLERRSPRS